MSDYEILEDYVHEYLNVDTTDDFDYARNNPKIMNTNYKILENIGSTHLEENKVFLVINTISQKEYILKFINETEKLVYSKLKSNRHPNLPEIVDIFECEILDVNRDSYDYDCSRYDKYIKTAIILNKYDANLSMINFTKLNYSIKKDLIKQIISGVLHLHRLGLYHGDLKPANICIENNNSQYIIKLIDFETSRSVDFKSEIKNTFPFCTPEAFQYAYIDMEKEDGNNTTQIGYKENGQLNDTFIVCTLIFYILGNRLPHTRDLWINFCTSYIEDYDVAKRCDIEGKKILIDYVKKEPYKIWSEMCIVYNSDIPKKLKKQIKKCMQIDENKRGKLEDLYKLF